MIDVLFRILEHEGVRVVYANLHDRHHLLEAYACPNKRKVVLDHSLPFRPRQHKCVLAEEVGHILYPPVNAGMVYHMAEYWECSHAGRSEAAYWHAKNERVALLWATEFLIPDRDFWEFAYEGPWDWHEWLERFDVEGWFMKQKMEFMRTKKPLTWRSTFNATARKTGGFGA